MNLTDKQKAEFRSLAESLIKWLNDNCHPHAHIVIGPTSAELSEGVAAFYTEEFLND